MIVASRLYRFFCRIIYGAFCKSKVGGFDGEPTVNGFSKFTRNTFIGKNCHFNGMKVLGYGKVLIGDNFHSGSGLKLITDVHNYEGDRVPYDDTYIIKDITIGDNVWIGSDVIILGGVKIGDGAIVQAGSVVVSDVGRCSIVGGSPARQFKRRNIAHYEKLVQEKKFH